MALVAAEVRPATHKRISALAKPKPVPQGFLEDRRSVYWENSIVKDWNGGDVATSFMLSDRQKQLVIPKSIHRDYVGDRPSPIWIVSKAAQTNEPSGRLMSLSVAKSLHPSFKPERSVYTIVSDAAKSSEPSQRIEQLARAKQYADLPLKPNSGWDWSEWESDIPSAALKAEASDRVTSLARPKNLHNSYKECRPVQWQVAPSARKTLPSLRVQQLARPKSRGQYKEDYDPNWWKVSSAARSAHASSRISELATPIPRKVRQKKVVAK